MCHFCTVPRLVRIALFVACLWPCAVQAAQNVSAKLEGSQVTISVDGALFTAYKFAPDQKYPYFWPVNGPVSGASVTTETSEPYPHHHSLFFGCDKVNGGNYWQEANERGQIVSQGPRIETAEGERIVFTDTCLWQMPGQAPIMRDNRTIAIAAPNETLRVIDFEITLEPLVGITIEKTNHSLFSARVVPELSVASGGTLVNAEGAKAEAGTFGVASPWCDYSGTRGDVTEGIAILQNPANRWFPARWFTRDYGFFSPTPMYWIENDRLEMAVGETLTLKYLIIVHAGNAQESGIAAQFDSYAKPAP